MSDPLVRSEARDDVVWLTLNNPQSLNALSLPVLEALREAVADVRTRGGVRCVVITGAGRAFCAGGDLLAFKADVECEDKGPFLAKLRYAQEVFTEIEQLPMPVIGAVNGDAIAGGLELLLCCDMIIAAESARLADGHARYGIIPGGGSTARLPRKIAPNRAAYMLLTAELLPAVTLERWGLVHQVVQDDELQPTVAALSAKMARLSPLGLGTIKQLLRASLTGTAEDAAEAELIAFAGYARSHDLAEGLAAFAEKRKPKFVGR